MSLFRTLSDLEASDSVHLGRLLILLNAFAGETGTEPIQGLTKLAKLDFLLRYPVYLERALKARNASIRSVKVAEHERKSVESTMIRYRYGPWDPRYRRFINLLVAKGLAEVKIEGRTVVIGLTAAGHDLAEQISRQDPFQDITRRAETLSTHFDYTGTYLMKFIYRTFPEICSLRLGEEIDL